MLAAVSRSWVVPTTTNLKELINTKRTYITDHKVSLNMTVNKTGKKGDNILSTPTLIAEMNKMACSIVDAVTAKTISPVIKHVVIQHKRPIKMGGDFKIQAEVKRIEPLSVTFHMKGINSESSEVLGEGDILVEIVRNE